MDEPQKPAMSQAEKPAPGMMQRVTDQLGYQPDIILEKGGNRGYWSAPEGITELGTDGELAREDYVERIEKAEFETRMETMELWEQAEAAGTVSGECIFDQSIRTLEDYWARARNGPHAEQYREQWDYYCKGAWNRGQRKLKKEQEQAKREADKLLKGKSNGIDK
ncbi:MAG: hypothetical protein ACI8RZ_003919 [Myxococcota bacterium]|jgi:hypothetical protein